MEQERHQSSEVRACPRFEGHVILYALEELEGADRDALEDHLDHCAACVVALDAERRAVDLVATQRRTEPSPAFLANCRDRLEDSINEIDQRSIFARWAESIFPAHWLILHPAASAVMLIFIGFSAGAYISWHPQPSPGGRPPQSTIQSSVLPDEQELRSADVSGINWTPSDNNRPPQVEVQMTTERPVVVQGTVDDREVKRVLLYVLHNSRRFSPDVRINAVDLLKGRAKDADVQQALCLAAQNDRNPAVRLQALDALTEAQPNHLVLQAMLNALVKDSNPGVRVEAINSLRSFTGTGAIQADPDAIHTLRERMRKDPNLYIRLQSAALVDQSTSGPQR
jgi:HEAT repeats